MPRNYSKSYRQRDPRKHDPHKAFIGRQRNRLVVYLEKMGCRGCGLRDEARLGLYDRVSLVRVHRSRYKAMDRGIMFDDLNQNAAIYCTACVKTARAELPTTE